VDIPTGRKIMIRRTTHTDEVIIKVVALLFALAVADQAQAQTAQVAPAADITNTEIQSAFQKTVSLPVSDQQLRMVSINGEYNVGAALVHRALWHTARSRKSTISFQGTGRS
jgi:hypothetical protein